jgi:hypothetical protein
MKPTIVTKQINQQWHAWWQIQMPFITTQHTFTNDPHIGVQFNNAIQTLLLSGYGFTYVFYKHPSNRNVEIFIKYRCEQSSQQDAEELARNRRRDERLLRRFQLDLELAQGGILSVKRRLKAASQAAEKAATELAAAKELIAKSVV